MDEIMRMVLQIEGQAKVKELTDQLKAQEQQMLDLIGQYKAGQLTLNQYTSSMRTAAAVAVPLSQDIDKLQSASRNLGLGALSASYAFQDFTSVLSGGGGFARALSSVQNNVPLLLTSLGAGVGLTGVVSAASVAVGLLIDNFGSLAKAFGADTSLQDKIDQLGKLKEASDKASESLGKQIEAMRKAEQAGPAGAGEIARAAIQQQGGVDATVNAVTSQMTDESSFATSKRQAANAAANEAAQARKVYESIDPQAPGKADAKRRLDAAEAKAATARQESALAESGIRQQAQQTIIGAGQGNQQDIRELARRFPGGAFGQATPEGMDEQDAFEQRMLVDEPDRTRRGARARNRDNAMGRALTRQGQEQEAALGRDQQKLAEEHQQLAEKMGEDAGRKLTRDADALRKIINNPVDLGKQANKLGDEIISNNKKLADLQSRGVDQTGRNQQQIAELLEINANLTARMDQVDAMLRKNDTKLKSLRSGGRPR